MRVNKNKIIGVLCSIMVLTIFITGVIVYQNPSLYHQEYRTNFSEELPAIEIEAAGEILSGDTIEQTFLSNEESIDSIQIGFATYGRKNKCNVKIELWNITTGELCGSWDRRGDRIPCYNYEVLSLDTPIENVKGEKFKVVIQSNDGKAGQAISVYKQNAEEYEDGQLLKNGQIIDGNIKLKITYSKQNVQFIDSKANVVRLALTIASLLCLGIFGLNKMIKKSASFNKNKTSFIKKSLLLPFKNKHLLFIVLIGSFLISFFIQSYRHAEEKVQFNFVMFIFIFVFFVCAYWLWNIRKKTIKIEQIFLFIALSAGLCFVFGEPVTTLVSWDDEVHYENVVKLSYLSKYKITKADEYMTKRILTKNFQLSSIKEEHEELNSLYYGKNNVVEQGTRNYSSIYNSVGYGPAAIIHGVGRLLHLPYTMIFKLGQLANLLLYSFLIYYGIKHLKSGKLILATIALFPTNIFLASNYSYDYWVTSWTMYGLAYLFGVLQNEEKVSIKDIIKILGSLFLGLGPKAIYFPIIILVFFIPEKLFHSKKQKWICWGATILTMLIVVGSFMVGFLVKGPGIGDSRGGSTVNSTGQVQFILQNPIEYTKILLRFIFCEYLNFSNSKQYTNLMGYLGMNIFNVVSMLLLVISIFFDCGKEKIIGLKERMVVFVNFFGTVCLVATALYVSFTPVGYYTINGCQLRYLLPLVFPIAYFLGDYRILKFLQTKKKMKFSKEILCFSCLMCEFLILFAGIFIRLIRCYY